MVKRIIAVCVKLCLLCAIIQAQVEYPYSSSNSEVPEWARLMYADSVDIGLVVDAYEDYYRTNPFSKNSHTQYYKRWLRRLSRELPGDGRDAGSMRYLAARNRESNSSRTDASTWQALGPFDWDHDAADRSYAPGAAHVYTVEQSLSDPDVLYAGTATAGIWRTDDHGLNWSSLTPDILTNGLSAIEINHLDPNTVYAQLLYSVYKSTDGGSTWVPTGDGPFQSLSLNIADIAMHPEDTQNVWLASNFGLFQSQDGGSDWDVRLTGDVQEIEFHPTNSDTIYVVRKNGDVTEFFRSVDGGQSFNQQTTGWPVPDVGSGEHQRRTEIAVTPAEADLVVALATGSANGGSGLYGIYISEDAGATWTFQCCGPQPAGPPSESNPNLMGWSDLGLDDGGQYYYDLALDISPTNADSIFVGGVNLWISDDGGLSFTCPAKWSHPQKPGYVHADIHDIRYYPATQEIWVGCDGGIFFSDDNGLTFTRRMFGIAGTDFWGFGAGARDGEVMLGGTYHNGTLLKDNDVYLNEWICTDGGDNYRGFVHPVHERTAFSDYNIKTLSGDREINNETRPFQHKPNASYTIGRSSDLLFHPAYTHTWYTGSGSVLWRTEDNGLTFDSIHDFGGDLAAMDLCMTNPDIIYVTTFPDWWDNKEVWKTPDGGKTWSNITPPAELLNGNLWVPYDIACSATDSNIVWLVRTSMYGGTDLGGAVVFKSQDGGQTWINYTDDLPTDEACTAIAHHNGSDGGVYLGTRRAVYYRNDALEGWQLYASGMPASTFCTRLIPNYREGTIRNGTNRSVWERDLYETAPPIAQPATPFNVARCLSDTIYFYDNSIAAEPGVAYAWSFPGGTPDTSSMRDPKVLYADPGIYDVSLTITDQNGSSTRTIEGFIKVINECGIEREPGLAVKTTVNPDYVQTPDIGIMVDSFTVTAWVRPEGVQNDYSGILINDGVTAGFNFREGNNTLGYHWPGGQWWWDSGLVVEPGEWSHVAMVVTPAQVRLYVNGIEAVHSTATDAVLLETMKIGSYKGWSDRNFRGQIDEVCIFQRALTRDEIRSKRHLTIDPGLDPSILAYYQFNEGGSIVFDKAGDRNASMNGGAIKVRSRGPFGAGVSQVQNINGDGTYIYADAGVNITFGPGSVNPQGDLWVSRVEVRPDTLPVGYSPAHNGYWILNNYGSNQVLLDPVELEFDPIGFVSTTVAAEQEGALMGRPANMEISGWSSMAKTTALYPGVWGKFTGGQFIAMEPGQFAVMRDSFPAGTAKVSISPVNPPLARRGGGSVELDMNGPGNRGLVLPVLEDGDFENTQSPQQGMLAYHAGEKTVCYFDGDEWYLLTSAFIDIELTPETLEGKGVTFANSVASGAIFESGDEGFILPPEFNDTTLLSIEYPTMGLLVFRPDPGSISVYDGAQWRTFEHYPSDLTVNTGTSPEHVAGLAIGTTSKTPGAVLHVESTSRGIGLPVARMALVPDPVEGLMVFDPDVNSLCVYDGNYWRVIKYQ